MNCRKSPMPESFFLNKESIILIDLFNLLIISKLNCVIISGEK